MSQKGPAALEPSGRGQPTHKNSAKIAIFAVVQKTLKMRTYREIFDGMLRAAALIMIMAMVAGACGKNNEPQAGPDNNTEQPSKPGDGDNTEQTPGPDGDGSGEQGGGNDGGESGDGGGNGSGGQGGSGNDGGNEGDNGSGDGDGQGGGNDGAMMMAREVAMKVENPEMVVVTAMATREASRIRK